ncbi:peptidase S41 [Candidatus Tenderia electrophaga]|jgi:carboxyl-terminal processing protease|uniref:Peptidase S41 n=1 Tax=Candidatus Tenderia electrophaga TaxID=1748243 RepID=A0A0S2THC2_9GAMM|nr:peptidase S41 [Candidatus Tenderia electrophaga]
MTFSTRNLLLVSLGLILGVSLTIGQGVLAEREEARQMPLPLDELRTFTEVFGKIKSDYVESTEDGDLLEGAIRGMLSGLDPHSTYLDPEAYKELQVGTSGEFGGLGIEVGMEDGFVKVISPIDDTPAERAGIEPGDLIIRIDDAPVKGLSLGEAVKLMRGKPGTKIVLTVVREGEDRPLKITITRAVIKVNSVKSRMLEPGFGYVRITQFQSNTGENLINALSELKRDNEGKLKGIVLDLRNNPGGVLNAAVAVSDAFLEDGLIVYTEGRIDDSEMKFKATPIDIMKGAPIVVLVNGGSASASEIVAGALQDHKRAIIMGHTTFGKGSVQTILPMHNGAALKLTTARYYTPSGRSIQAEGIVPDIPLENVKLAELEPSPFEPIKEANLSRHLENGDGDTQDAIEDGASDAASDDEKKEESLAKRDYQLYEALNLLKGLEILQR